MKHKRQHDDVTMERLERARAAIAYAMTLDGAVYGPIFERLEREIAARRAADDVMARAQAMPGRLRTRRLACGRRQGDQLKIFELEAEAVAVAVFRLVGAVPHHLVDQFLGRLDRLEPILEAVPEASRSCACSVGSSSCLLKCFIKVADRLDPLSK